MRRIADALRKVHADDPWRQIAPAAATEADVGHVLASLPSGEDEPGQAAAPPPSAPAAANRTGALTGALGLSVERSAWATVRDPLNERLIVNPQTDVVATEQYRRLASLLHQAQLDRPLKVVMVTSAMPGEGKTLTATNLALTLSGTFEREVLLIDTDLRRSTLARVFQARHLSGMSEALRAERDKRLKVLHPTSRLSVLLGGEPDPNPIAGLSSDRMRALLAEAADHFDWVIVDTPPAAIVPDVGLLAPFVDAAILVIRPGVAPSAAVLRAVEAIRRERIIGVVLNGAKVGPLHSYDYYSAVAPREDGSDAQAEPPAVA